MPIYPFVKEAMRLGRVAPLQIRESLRPNMKTVMSTEHAVVVGAGMGGMAAASVYVRVDTE